MRRLIARMGQKIADKRLLRLVGIMLRSGVMVDGVVNPSKEGAMQGGPLSPLLSNIVLDELDRNWKNAALNFAGLRMIVTFSSSRKRRQSG